MTLKVSCVSLNTKEFMAFSVALHQDEINSRVDDGRLPLQFACDYKKPFIDLAISLVTHGADVSIR